MQKAKFFPKLSLPIKKQAPSIYEKPSQTKTFTIYTDRLIHTDSFIHAVFNEKPTRQPCVSVLNHLCIFMSGLIPITRMHLWWWKLLIKLIYYCKLEDLLKIFEWKTFSGRICPFTGKKSNRKNLVSHSNHKTKKLQFVNLQYKRVWWEAGKRFVKLRLSTKALKTIEKNGLDAVAKKAGIDLKKK